MKIAESGATLIIACCGKASSEIIAVINQKGQDFCTPPHLAVAEGFNAGDGEDDHLTAVRQRQHVGTRSSPIQVNNPRKH